MAGPGIIQKFYSALNESDACSLSQMIDLPFCVFGNECTAILTDMPTFQAQYMRGTGGIGVAARIRIAARIDARETLCPGLAIGTVRSHIETGRGQRSDQWTEYFLIRSTPNGDRLVAHFNPMGGAVDFDKGLEQTVCAAPRATVDTLLAAFATAVQSGDMQGVNVCLEYPSIMFGPSSTFITPGPSEFFRLTDGLVTVIRERGLRIRQITRGRVRAAGATMVLANVNLHFDTADGIPLPPASHVKCLRVRPEGVGCVGIINAFSGALESVYDQHMKRTPK